MGIRLKLVIVTSVENAYRVNVLWRPALVCCLVLCGSQPFSERNDNTQLKLGPACNASLWQSHELRPQRWDSKACHPAEGQKSLGAAPAGGWVRPSLGTVGLKDSSSPECGHFHSTPTPPAHLTPRIFADINIQKPLDCQEMVTSPNHLSFMLSKYE